ncbi:MAG: hypothetical protein LQ347_000577 [Umbilicaria vellea]|nr:MAG: hypothetical protein LQ347_000577 [Umbilicaria vellea]
MTPAPVASRLVSTPDADEDQQGFFRPWAIRQSEASNSDTSPSVSPMTVARRRNTREGDKGRSQASLSEHSLLAYEDVATTLVAQSISVSAASAGNRAVSYAGACSESLRSSQPACVNSPFISSYAEKSTKRPPLRGTQIVNRDGSSSQTILPGFSPKLQNAGDWPEERIHASKPIGQNDIRLLARPASASEVLRPTRPTITSDGSSGSHASSIRAPWKVFGGFDAQGRQHENPEARMLGTKLEKEGLYRRIRRYFGLRYKEPSRSNLGVSELRQQGTETDEMLKGVSRMLKDHPEEVYKTLDIRSGGVGLPNKAESSRPAESLSSSYEVGVVSDSWFVWTDGTSQPPLNTPDPDAIYRGPDDRAYFKVELSAPDAPTFLPSEAIKISTPPSSPRRNKAGKMRGFFFDVDAVRAAVDLPQRGADDTHPRTAAIDAYQNADTDINWFRVSVGFETVEDEFQLDIPDHLPNSPLCPLHPKNKSGGTGICVYHGRRHSSL